MIETSGHLPECSNRPYNGERCICDRLRACEQRVLSQYVDGIELVSYRKGLTAARDAVEALLVDEDGWDQHDEWMNDALAAIDALRGDR